MSVHELLNVILFSWDQNLQRHKVTTRWLVQASGKRIERESIRESCASKHAYDCPVDDVDRDSGRPKLDRRILTRPGYILTWGYEVLPVNRRNIGRVTGSSKCLVACGGPAR